MSRRTWALLGAAVSTLWSGAALADDYDWSGFRLGATVGVGMGAVAWDEIDAGLSENLGTFGSLAVNGGVFAGYDLEVAPGMVFGLEAGLQFFNAEGSSTQLTVLDQYEFRSLGAAYAGVRAGGEVAAGSLLYGRLSYAAIHAESSVDTPAAQEGFVHGYQAAIGLETEVMDNVTVRVEGTYTKALTSFETNYDGSVYLDTYTPDHLGVNVGVTYRFGNEGRGPRLANAAPQRSWSGGYVGVLAGGMSSSTVNGFRETAIPGAEGPVSYIGYELGAYVGVTQQLGEQFVVGLEGEASYHTAVWDFVDDESRDIGSSDHKAQVSARLGFLVNPATLIYARAGWGLMHINPDGLLAEPGTEAAYVQTLSAGLGIEVMTSPNSLLRAEGIYTTAIEEYRFNDTVLNPLYIKPSSLSARVGMAFLF